MNVRDEYNIDGIPLAGGIFAAAAVTPPSDDAVALLLMLIVGFTVIGTWLINARLEVIRRHYGL